MKEMIKIINEFASLLVDFVDLGSIYPSVVVCHLFVVRKWDPS
jgi:hypothetical protein